MLVINTIVFARFHSFTYLVNLMVSDRCSNILLVVLFVFWVHFFGFVSVLAVGLKFNDFLGVPWRGPRLKPPGQEVVKGLSVGYHRCLNTDC